MKGRRLRRAMVHLSVGGSLALVLTLLLLSSGGEVSLAQLSVSPSCAIIDPITGLCETVTSILSPSSSPTSTTTTTSTPTSTTTTATSSTSSTTTSTSTSSTTSGTSDGTSGGTTGTTGTTAGGSTLSDAPFGGSAYGPGGLFSGAYTGNFGGGTTYFAPTAQTLTSRQVYFQSALGAPVSKEVATAAFDLGTIQAAPVASAATQVPRIMLLVVPAALLILVLVTSLVLEDNEGGTGNAAIRSSRI
jgi:hypothetical protein